MGYSHGRKWDCYIDKWEYFIKYSLFISNLREVKLV